MNKEPYSRSAARKYFYPGFGAALVILLLFVAGCDGETEESGQTFKYVCDSTNTCGTGMILVSEGEFIMGNDSSETFPVDAISPQHPVWLDSFCIDTHETTNQEYMACVEAGTCTVPRTEFNNRNTGYTELGYMNHPVVGLTWEQANAYCSWKGKRLPTEAEWEKAARGPAPNKWLYPWGTNDMYSEENDYPAHICPLDSPVGMHSTGVSTFCVYDLAGGAPEYTSDFYSTEYYANSPYKNPTGPATGSQHVVRGGACFPCSTPGWAPDIYSLVRRFECEIDSAPMVGVRCVNDAPNYSL